MNLRSSLRRVATGKEVEQFKHNRNKDDGPRCPEEVFEKPKRDVATEKISCGTGALDILRVYRTALILFALIGSLGSTRQT